MFIDDLLVLLQSLPKSAIDPQNWPQIKLVADPSYLRPPLHLPTSPTNRSQTLSPLTYSTGPAPHRSIASSQEAIRAEEDVVVGLHFNEGKIVDVIDVLLLEIRLSTTDV